MSGPWQYLYKATCVSYTCLKHSLQAASEKLAGIVAEHKAGAEDAKPSTGSVLSNIASTVAQAAVGGGEARTLPEPLSKRDCAAVDRADMCCGLCNMKRMGCMDVLCNCMECSFLATCSDHRLCMYELDC